MGSAHADSVGVWLDKDGGWLGSSSDKKEEKRKRKKTTTMARLPLLALVLVSALLFLSSPQGDGARCSRSASSSPSSLSASHALHSLHVLAVQDMGEGFTS